MARNIENAIEWYTGDDTMTVTLSQQKYINRVLQLASNNDSVQIVAKNADGSICAHLPLKALHLMIYRQNTGGFPAVRDIPEADDEP